MEPEVLRWQATCQDCGFISGFAQIKFPNKTGITITGAGCFTRRDPKATEKWIEDCIKKYLENNEG